MKVNPIQPNCLDHQEKIMENCTNCAGSLVHGGTPTNSRKDITSNQLIFKVFQLINLELDSGFLCNRCYSIILDIEELQKEFIRLSCEPRESSGNHQENHSVYQEDESFYFDPLEKSLNQSKNVDEEEKDPRYEEVNVKIEEDVKPKVLPEKLKEKVQKKKIGIKREKVSKKKSQTKNNEHIKSKTCETCEKKFKNSRSLKLHKKEQHTNSDELPFKCTICPNKGFMSNNKFSDHMNYHTGNKPHKCNFCEKGFADGSSRLRHEKSIHFGIKRT